MRNLGRTFWFSTLVTLAVVGMTAEPGHADIPQRPPTKPELTIRDERGFSLSIDRNKYKVCVAMPKSERVDADCEGQNPDALADGIAKSLSADQKLVGVGILRNDGDQTFMVVWGQGNLGPLNAETKERVAEDFMVGLRSEVSMKDVKLLGPSELQNVNGLQRMSLQYPLSIDVGEGTVVKMTGDTTIVPSESGFYHVTIYAPENSREKTATLRNELLSTLKARSPKVVEDELAGKSPAYQAGYRIGRRLGLGLFVGIFLAIVFRLTRKKPAA